MSASCLLNEPCGFGTGVCGNSSVCMCNHGSYSDSSDFAWSTGCAVYKPIYILLWTLNGLAWFVAMVCTATAHKFVKRKSPVAEQWERWHTAVCFISSLCATALSILQLVIGHGTIGMEIPSSVLFAVSQILCWCALVMKPSTTRETSIARFAMEQNRAILVLYSILAPIFVIKNTAAGCIVIAAAVVDSSSEQPKLIESYFIITGAAYAVISLHSSISIWNARKKLDLAMNQSMVVSKRVSVRNRMEKFAGRAKRVMFTSLIGMILFSIVNFVIGACVECRQDSVWVLLPIMLLCVSGWIIRAGAVSVRVSQLNRQAAKKNLKELVGEMRNKSSEGESPSPPSPPSSKMHRKKTRSKTHSKGKKETHVKKAMTVVLEADYEGTVTGSQLGSVAPISPQASNRHMNTLFVHEEAGSSSEANHTLSDRDGNNTHSGMNPPTSIADST